MTSNVVAALAAAGMLSAGVAAASETRSSAAIPMTTLSARSLPGATVAVAASHAKDRPDCALEANAGLPACANPGGNGGGLGGVTGQSGGVSGVVLGVLAVGGIGAAVALGSKSDSNG